MTNEINQQVLNYRNALSNLNVNDSQFSNPKILEMSELKNFIEQYSDANGIRIYLSKETDSNNTLDHRMILVPCKKTDGNEDFEDFDLSDPSLCLFARCRNPPNCTAGAKYL